MKKFISLFLAMMMAFALAIPAFADDPAPAYQTVAVEGKISTPTISIEAPSSVVLTLNPYQMKYNGDIKVLKDKQDQILSVPAVYVNKTDVDLRLELTATATVATSITLTDAAIDADTTTKQVWLKMQFGEYADKAGAAWKASTAPTAETFDTSTKKVEYTYSTTAADNKSLKMDATDGKNANYFGFQFSGSATLNPTTAWASTDTIGVSAVLTVTPIALTVSST